METPSLSKESVFDEIRKYSMKKDGAVEEYPWGDVAWKVSGKMFACGGEGHNTFTVKSTLDEQAYLIQNPAIEKAAYVGRYGWVTITVADEETLALAKELVDVSYELVKPRGGRRAK